MAFYYNIDLIRNYAFKLHEKVNHTYDELPYSIHLRMTAINIKKYCRLNKDNTFVAECAAYLHDTIEDTRTTYNDLFKDISFLLVGYNERLRFSELLDDDYITFKNIVDIVYLLTNNKGKNRKERVNNEYYDGIKSNQLAIIVKLCDRLANLQYNTLFLCEDKMDLYYKEHEEFMEKMGLMDRTYDIHNDDGIDLSIKLLINAIECQNNTIK